jgi:pimeloyl-ACP methyl ester carboxylesterase
MTKELDMTKARKIPPSYDNRGNPTWKTRMSAPDDSFAQCLMVPDRIIPVIFVPGVMGSNLIQKGVDPKVAVKWRMDGPGSAASWSLPSSNAAFRKQYLQPHAMEVDKGGMLPEGTGQQAEELRRRGWGEVGAMSYAPFLVWLENALNDFDDPHAGLRVALMKEGLQAMKGEELLSHDEVGLSYRYRMPVHACGYNWLDDNAVSALRLGRRIDEIIQRYRDERKKCEKVILVTHSMGGLVARHCSEVHSDQDKALYRDKILGVVHGVMPTIGAAAVYRRFKAGTENPKSGFVESAKGAVGASVLGNDAAEMTAVLSSAPGPLQLLPTPEYGNGWLKIKDGSKEYSLPRNGDPYGEIYAVGDKWWSMCEKHLINPLNEERHPEKRAAQIGKDWGAFTKLIDVVEEFHVAIKSCYHPNTHAFFGSHADQKAFGNVTWQRIGMARVATEPMDARPQNLDQISTTRTVKAPMVGQPSVSLVRHFMIQEPEENGDGTVPHRSGIASQSASRSFLQVNVGHEPAYKHGDGADNLRACRFTLRAIVKIAQDVVHTALKYD